MSAAVKAGNEKVAHGTVAAAFTSVPAAFTSKPVQGNRVLDEDRNGQDRHFTMQKGVRHQEWEVGESWVYHDSIGIFLRSLLGTPTKVETEVGTVFDCTFKFADDPNSLSLQWTQPRRAVQSYQSLYCTPDEATFTFTADGDLKWSMTGVGIAETEISAITHSFSSTAPFASWLGAVTLGGGSHTRLISGMVKVKRNRKPFWTFNNTQDLKSISAGWRSVEFELVVDFDTKTEYDAFKAASTTAFLITWVDADVTIGASSNPEFEIDLGTIGYEVGEIDTDPDYPRAKVTGKAMYDATDASIGVFRVQSTVDYSA